MKPALLFCIESQDALQRLDVFLSQQEKTLSRSQIKRLIEQGQVKVGGKKTKAGLRLKTGDEVSVVLPEPRNLEVRAEPLPLTILFEDSHLLVIDKPAGMVVHPGAGNYSGTLVNALLHHCRDLGGIGGVLRPGIVHRLDKDTSGVLVVAKNDAAHRGLSEQFKRHYPREKIFRNCFRPASRGRTGEFPNRPSPGAPAEDVGAAPEGAGGPNPLEGSGTLPGFLPGGVSFGNRKNAPDPGPSLLDRPPAFGRPDLRREKGACGNRTAGSPAGASEISAPGPACRHPGIHPPGCRGGTWSFLLLFRRIWKKS